MLKISEKQHDARSVVFQLEGQLIEPWVTLLKDLCHDHVGDLALVLDLSALDFASHQGVALLVQLEQAGIECISWPPLLRELAKSYADHSVLTESKKKLGVDID